jgi:hypothetical protein
MCEICNDLLPVIVILLIHNMNATMRFIYIINHIHFWEEIVLTIMNILSVFLSESCGTQTYKTGY